jgi:hypothetical protein
VRSSTAPSIFNSRSQVEKLAVAPTGTNWTSPERLSSTGTEIRMKSSWGDGEAVPVEADPQQRARPAQSHLPGTSRNGPSLLIMRGWSLEPRMESKLQQAREARGNLVATVLFSGSAGNRRISDFAPGTGCSLPPAIRTSRWMIGPPNWLSSRPWNGRDCHGKAVRTVCAIVCDPSDRMP